MPPDDEDIEALLQDFSTLFQDMPPAPSLPDLFIAAASASPTALIIRTDKGDIKIEGTGEVTLPEGCSPSEAATEFWKYIHIIGSQKEELIVAENQALQKIVRELEAGIESRNRAICRLTAELEDLKCNGQKHPDINRFEDIMEDDNGGSEGNQGDKG